MQTIFSKPIFRVFSLGLVGIILAYYAYNKIGFHVDELYSYGLSNSFDGPFPNQTNQWLTGNYYRQYLTTEWGHRFNYVTVYNNQVQDVHPPLYYFLFHTIASCFPGVFNQWLGLALNFITHLGSIWLIWKIMGLISKKEELNWLTGMVWGLSMGGINTFAFIRMYSLVTFFGLLLLFQAILILQTESMTYHKLLGFTITIFLGVLSHYYFLIYAFFLVGFLILLLLFKRKMTRAFTVGVGSLIGVLAAYLFFPAMKTHLTQSNRGTETYDNLRQQGLFTNLNYYLDFLSQDLFATLPWLLVGVVLLIGGLKGAWESYRTKDPKNLLPIIMIACITLFYFSLVQVISHYVTPRYIYIIYPLIIILWSLALDQVIGSVKHGKILIFLTFTCMTLWSHWNLNPTYTYPEQAQLTKLTSLNKNASVITITDQKWKNISLVPELGQYQDIYPWTTAEVTSADTPVLKPKMTQGPLIVYLQHPKVTSDMVIGVFTNTYNYKQAKVLYQNKNLTMIRLDP